MAERETGQLSLADSLVWQSSAGSRTLERIAELVDWVALEGLLRGLRHERMGAPGYPSLVLLKALLLQQWYALSDPALEEALADRLSFRRFLGLSLEERTPDHTTLWRFRERLGTSGAGAKAFAEIERQISGAGFVLKQGTLIDASLLASAVNPPPVPVDLPAPDADGRPGSKLVRSMLDPDAAWTKTTKGYRFGYKMHLAMDETSRIVRRAVFTPANVNESAVADALICGDEKIVLADKAYDSNARRDRLAVLGIEDGIARRANRWHPGDSALAARNAVIARRRGPVESLFALIKNVYGMARARYRSLVRNACAFHLALIANNLKRWSVIAV